jgi:hypothetical protein
MRRLLPIAFIGLVLLLPATASAAAGPGSARVSGTVTPTAIAPEVEVCLVEVPARPSEVCTAPRPDGTYLLTGLPIEIPFKVEFIPSYRSHAAVQYYDHAATLAEATAILIKDCGLPPCEQAEVDADLKIGAQIEGTVTAASGGDALGEVEVCVLEAGKHISDGCTYTDGAGHYQFRGLSPGNYKVGFWGHNESAEYAPRYYAEAATLDQATVISVSAGMTIAGVDVSLAKGAQVRGTVVAAVNGAALENIPVCIFAAASAMPTQCTYTGPGGSYSLLGIPTGSYQVGFSLGSAEIGGEAVSSEDDGYLTQYFDEVSSRAEAATLILAAPQIAAGIDAHLMVPALPPVPAAPAGFTGPPATAVPPIPDSASKPLKCRRGYRRKKVKDGARCVKVRNKKRKSSRKSRHHSQRNRKSRTMRNAIAFPEARTAR